MVLALTLTGMRIYQVTRGQRSPCRPGPCRAAALGPALGTRPLLSCRRCPAPCSCCTTSPGPTLGSWRSWCVSGGVAARRVPPTKSPGVPSRACPQAVYWAPRPPPDPVPGCLGPGALTRAQTRPCTGGAGTSPPSGSHAENVRGNGGAQTCIVWPPPSRRPCPCGPGPRAVTLGQAWPSERKGREHEAHWARRAGSLDGEPEAWGPVPLLCALPRWPRGRVPRACNGVGGGVRLSPPTEKPPARGNQIRRRKRWPLPRSGSPRTVKTHAPVPWSP